MGSPRNHGRTIKVLALDEADARMTAVHAGWTVIEVKHAGQHPAGTLWRVRVVLSHKSRSRG